MTANAAERIKHEGLRAKIMPAEQAAEFVQNGMTLAITGFTGAGYPKALPTAIAERAKAAHARGEAFAIGMITGASTAPECDGVLAAANCVSFRNPFQSDPGIRNSINAGNIAYQDMHLSHVEQQMRQGFYGNFDIAIIEASGITADGKIKPCLFSNLEYDVRKLGVKNAIHLAVENKPLAGTTNQIDCFSNIGG